MPVAKTEPSAPFCPADDPARSVWDRLKSPTTFVGITLLGLYLPVLFSGTVFIEYVFAWPGMGNTIVGAITTRDYPVVMATSLIFACMVVVGNLIADVLYAVVDPRIRYD